MVLHQFLFMSWLLSSSVSLRSPSTQDVLTPRFRTNSLWDWDYSYSEHNLHNNYNSKTFPVNCNSFQSKLSLERKPFHSWALKWLLLECQKVSNTIETAFYSVELPVFGFVFFHSGEETNNLETKVHPPQTQNSSLVTASNRDLGI